MPSSPDPFAAALLDWFADHGRHDLPWQTVRDPYRIWVSEIMLQQTQVATVIPYFERFVDRFPDVATLASAKLDDVLALWSGLGYYARARNLHRAAGFVVERHAGRLPRDREALCALPGIGRSTAAAILALSWNEPQAILDGNVKRVLARYHGVRGYSGKASVLARLWALAEAHTPAGRAGEYTQAIMDLGATVCTRGRPQCARCPVAAGCVALDRGLIDELPSPRPKRERPERVCTVALLVSDDGVLLERRPPAGIWGGLLSLPEIPDDTSPAEWCRGELGLAANETVRLEPVRHGFTHFELTLNPVLLRATAGGSVLDGERWLWYNTARPLPGGMPAPIGRLIEQAFADGPAVFGAGDTEA